MPLALSGVPLLFALLMLLPAISQAEVTRSRSAPLQVSFEVMPSCAVADAQSGAGSPLVVCNYTAAPTVNGSLALQPAPAPAKSVQDANGVVTISYALPG